MKLDDREQLVLRTIINEYIQKSEPVGSRNVSKIGPLKMSPATIRNIMGDLEEKGFLVQPHTSAGRIPTDMAYRYYIDHFVGLEKDFDAVLRDKLDESLHFPASNLQSMLQEFSKRLGALTGSVGFVVTTRSDSAEVRHIEFTRLNKNSVLAILISENGLVQNVIIAVEPELTENELSHFSGRINEGLARNNLSELAAQLQNELSADKSEIYNNFVRLKEVQENPYGIFVEGTSNILNFPEFQDASKLKGLLKTLEEKTYLSDILEKCMGNKGVQIFVGSEIGIDDSGELGLVTKSYEQDGRIVGMLGVIGPKRMQYSKMISVVNYSAEIITQMLNQLYGGYSEEEG